MASIRSHLIRHLFVKNYMKKVFDVEKKSVEQIRRDFLELSKKAKLPKGTVIEKETVANLPAEWVRAANVPKEKQQMILFFHGGGFAFGSCDTYRDLAARISGACGVQVLVIEYRLAPEHKYPVANDDCLTAYRWLISDGVSPKKIILGGDSAGCSLALMTLISLRDAKEPLPAGAFLFSPWDMINFDGESYISRAELDPLLNRKMMQISANYYIGSSVEKPQSLLSQNLAGLPSLFIQCGDHEVALSDSIRLADRAKEAGVDITLDVWDYMWHGFQGFSGIVPEAKQALDNLGRFVRIQFNEKKKNNPGDAGDGVRSSLLTFLI